MAAFSIVHVMVHSTIFWQTDSNMYHVKPPIEMSSRVMDTMTAQYPNMQYHNKDPTD